eukprot:669167-Hanusia_phi.AAC.2
MEDQAQVERLGPALLGESDIQTGMHCLYTVTPRSSSDRRVRYPGLGMHWHRDSKFLGFPTLSLEHATCANACVSPRLMPASARPGLNVCP